MTGWLELLIPHLKALYVALLAVCTAGLLPLPRMLSRHDPSPGQADYTRSRRAAHYGYAFVVTPAAVAIASGTLLIFLREVFVLWMFAKLVAVVELVAFHAWVGHSLVAVTETGGRHAPLEPLVPTLSKTSLPPCHALPETTGTLKPDRRMP